MPLAESQINASSPASVVPNPTTIALSETSKAPLKKSLPGRSPNPCIWLEACVHRKASHPGLFGGAANPGGSTGGKGGKRCESPTPTISDPSEETPPAKLSKLPPG